MLRCDGGWFNVKALQRLPMVSNQEVHRHFVLLGAAPKKQQAKDMNQN